MSIVYRVLCGAAAICIGLGLLLGVIGAMTGARPADLYLSPTDLPAFRFVSRGSPIWGRDTVEANYPVGEVQSLDFELQTMNVTIREGDGFHIRAKDVNAKRFVTELKGNTWRIRCDTDSFGPHMSLPRNWEGHAPLVDITVPKGWTAQEMEISMGMGNLTTDGLSAMESSIDVGMASVVMGDFFSRDCSIQVGMGSLTLDGALTGDCDIDCGMGSASLLLNGAEDDYGCTATAGMGTITFGRHECGGLGGSMTVSSGAVDNFFTINSGMGTVDVQFTR